MTDAGAVGDPADDLLDAAGGVAEGIVKGKVIREECEGALCERYDSALCFLSERAAFAVDQEPAVLPEDAFFSEAGQLRNAQAGVQERENYDFLNSCAAGVGEAVGVRIG